MTPIKLVYPPQSLNQLVGQDFKNIRSALHDVQEQYGNFILPQFAGFVALITLRDLSEIDKGADTAAAYNAFGLAKYLTCLATNRPIVDVPKTENKTYAELYPQAKLHLADYIEVNEHLSAIAQEFIPGMATLSKAPDDLMVVYAAALFNEEVQLISARQTAS